MNNVITLKDALIEKMENKRISKKAKAIIKPEWDKMQNFFKEMDLKINK